MGLQLRGGLGDGHRRGGAIRLQVAGSGLPQGVLVESDPLHHGEGQGRSHAKPRRDVQQADKVRSVRREDGARLRLDSHWPLRADRVDRRQKMADDKSRPRERPDRLPRADIPMATEEGHIPHWPLREKRGEGDSGTRAPDQRQAQGLARHLLPRQHQLRRIHTPLCRREDGRRDRTGDRQEDRRAQGPLVSHHWPAQGPRSWWRAMVCG